jgi:hypothetical protein
MSLKVLLMKIGWVRHRCASEALDAVEVGLDSSSADLRLLSVVIRVSG